MGSEDGRHVSIIDLYSLIDSITLMNPTLTRSSSIL